MNNIYNIGIKMKEIYKEDNNIFKWQNIIYRYCQKVFRGNGSLRKLLE
jgi:hypothetical protein